MKSLFLLAGLLAASTATSALAQPAVSSVQPFMVGLSVADMDKMTSWYGDMLGFKVTKDVPMGQGGGKVRFIESGTQRIELIFSPGSKPGPLKGTPPGHATTHGLAQLTMEVPDLDAATAALAAKGVKIELNITPIPPLGIRIMFFRDPEGNLLELVQRIK